MSKVDTDPVSQSKSKVLAMAESEFVENPKPGEKPRRAGHSKRGNRRDPALGHIAIGNAKRQMFNACHDVKPEFSQKYLDGVCSEFNRRCFGEALSGRLLVACVSYKNEFRYIYG
jgi:hypothetical protein